MGIFKQPLPEVLAYLDEVERVLRELPGGKNLTRRQKFWLGFCLTGIIVTHTLCWERFVRGSAGFYAARALSAMLHWAPIPWGKMLIASSLWILRAHGIREGILAIDDTDRPRSKSTTRIFGVHKTFDKKTNGFFMAQNIVKLVLISKSITFPVGFEFFRPDPVLKAWSVNDRRLKDEGVKKAERPKKPPRDKAFPSRQNIAAKLLRQFKCIADFVAIKAIVFDAAYMSKYFRGECAKIYPQAQLISQLKSSQIVTPKSGKAKNLRDYFAKQKPVSLNVRLRDMEPTAIEMVSARLKVQALKGRTMLVIALKYAGETDYRYIVANNITWRSLDVVKAYAFRWLVEVVIEDWKLYEGFGKLAYQQGEDGARRGLCLSLLVDQFLLQHPQQLRLAQTGQPLQTVGTMMRQLQTRCLIRRIESILESAEPKAALQEFAQQLFQVVQFRPSDKHMSGKAFGDLGPSPALHLRFANTA